MNAERGPSISTATIARPSISIRESSPLRPSGITPISSGIVPEVPGSRINLGGLKTFAPNTPSFVNEGPVTGFDMKNTAEFAVNLPGISNATKPTSEVHVSKRSVGRHRKSPVREIDRFRPQSLSRPETKPISRISSPDVVSALPAPDTHVRPDQVRIPRGDHVSVKSLEEVGIQPKDTNTVPEQTPSVRIARTTRISSRRFAAFDYGLSYGAIPKLKPEEDEQKDQDVSLSVPVARIATELRLGSSLYTPVKPDVRILSAIPAVPETEVSSSIDRKLQTKEKVVFDAKTVKPTARKEKNDKKPKKKIKFIVDKQANDKRLEAITKTRKDVEERIRLIGEVATWSDVVNELPAPPPDPMNSAIVRGKAVVDGAHVDGSIPVVYKALKALGQIFPKQDPAAILRNIPAVAASEEGESVGDEDVRRVVGKNVSTIYS